MSNLVLCPRGDNCSEFKNNALFIVFRFAFEQLQWIIPVAKKSLSEQCEGGLKC